MNHDDEAIDEDPLDDDAFDKAFAQAIQSAVRVRWVTWTIRLAIGITAVAVCIYYWPHLWWIALVYAPFPVLSAVALRRAGRRPSGDEPGDSPG